MDLGGLVAPQPIPLLAVAALQLGLALRRKESWRFLVGSACLIGAVRMAAGRSGLDGHQNLVAYHGGLAALMVIGVLFDDPLARFCRGAGAALLALACLTAFRVGPVAYGGAPSTVVRAYPFVLSLAAAGYGYLTGCRAYYAAATVALLGWLTVVGWQGYSGLRGSSWG